MAKTVGPFCKASSRAKATFISLSFVVVDVDIGNMKTCEFKEKLLVVPGCSFSYSLCLSNLGRGGVRVGIVTVFLMFLYMG